MQSISKLLSFGLKYFPLRVVLKMETFPSLTTCDMLFSRGFGSSKVRRLTETYLERRIRERKIDTGKRKDYKAVKTQVFSGQQSVSCLLLHAVDSERF